MNGLEVTARRVVLSMRLTQNETRKEITKGPKVNAAAPLLEIEEQRAEKGEEGEKSERGGGLRLVHPGANGVAVNGLIAFGGDRNASGKLEDGENSITSELLIRKCANIKSIKR